MLKGLARSGGRGEGALSAERRDGVRRPCWAVYAWPTRTATAVRLDLLASADAVLLPHRRRGRT